MSLPLVRRGPGAGRRRARRRRAVLLGASLAGVVAVLALPVRAVAGTPSPIRPVRHAPVAGASIYVVRPGDTLWSIAARFDAGGDPRPMAEALAKETGFAAVVPGERIVIP